MRYIISFYFVSLFTYASFAQSVTPILTDDLVAGKLPMLSKFTPLNNGELLYAAYHTAPNVFISKINDFKLTATKQVEVDKTLIRLKKKDIDFFARNIVEYYRMNYGTDSIAKAEVYRISNEKRSAPNFSSLIQQAAAKVQVKKLNNEEKKQLEDFIINDVDLNDAELYKRSAAYREWIDTYLFNLLTTKYSGNSLPYEDKKALSFEIINRELKPGLIKDYLAFQAALNALGTISNPDKLEKLYIEFISGTKNQNYKTVVNEAYNNVILSRPNTVAPDFSYYDVDGEQVILTELRGKFVYIDVWATWCGPCKDEFPALAMLERDYHGKNITFVSLSVDKITDKAKWANYVKQHELGGIQVLSDKDFSSDFTRKFNIVAIPRFILIDPEGKIVSPNAPRPSDPGLRKQLDDLLN